MKEYAPIVHAVDPVGRATGVRVLPKVVSCCRLARLPVAMPLRLIPAETAGDPVCGEATAKRSAAFDEVATECASQEQAFRQDANDPSNTAPPQTKQLFDP